MRFFKMIGWGSYSSRLMACIVSSLFFVSMTHAQHMFDVGRKALPEMKVKALLEDARQRLTPAVDVGRDAEISLAGLDGAKAGLVLYNDLTGKSAVLSDFGATCNEVSLTPLLIAELKSQGLGEADVFRCFLVEDLESALPVVRKTFRVSGVTDVVKLPVFNYGPKDNFKVTAISERTLIGVFRMKPRLVPTDPNDSELLTRIAAMEDARAYPAYTYQLPDGTVCTYDEIQVSQQTAGGIQPQGIVVGSSLLFDLALTGMTAQQQTATEYAAGLWGTQLAGDVPVTVSIAFATLDEGVLAQSYSPSAYLYGSVYYPSGMRNQLVGYDINTSLTDIRLEFNTLYQSEYYYGTDLNAGGNYDFPTVLLHEMAHGLGFYDSIDSSTGEYGYGTGDYPLIYDTFLYYGGNRLTNLTPASRLTAIISNALYFDGAAATTANGGARIKLYAPTTYAPGSSVSHWDTSVTFDTWMKYAYSSPLHTFNNRKIGLMKDLGWALPSDLLRVIGLSGNLDFGSVVTGNSATAMMTITNKGSQTLTVSGITYPTGFSGNWSSGTISATGSRNVTVTFAPASAQLYGGTITVVSDKTSGNNTLNCSGIGNAPAAAFFDNVETRTAFAVNNAPPWTFNDVDQSGTYGIDGTTFANQYSAMAFMVFNPGQVTPSLSGAWNPYSGSQYFACFAATTPPNNDWLISPQLSFSQPFTFSFRARSYTSTYGLERFKVGYSTTGNAPANFTTVSAGTYVQAPTAWTAYSYTIPASAKYIAINCVSDDAFAFMVDDLYYAPPVTIVTNTSSVSVPEGGTQTFQVRLSAQPAASTSVSVSRTAGDNNITISGGASLTFTTVNWSTYQTVTLAAAQDADTVNGSATITCSASGLSSVTVTATEIDNDTTLTVIADTGGTVSPSGGATVVTIGVATGITATPSIGYSFVNWTVTSGSATIANANATNTIATISAPATVRANFNLAVTPHGTPYAWLDLYGLVTGGDYNSADEGDTDSDNFAAWQEYQADTVPTNGQSLLKVTGLESVPGGMKIGWKGGVAATQWLEAKYSLGNAGELWVAIFTNVPPTSTSTNYTHSGVPNAKRVYRVRAAR